MTKSSVVFACAHCDAQYPKWQGRCGECSQWGTIAEVTVAPVDRRKVEARPGAPVSFADITPATEPRSATGIPELDRVLGGGIVPGSLILLGGDPGIGKSTLVLQLAVAVASKGSVMYVSGEESGKPFCFSACGRDDTNLNGRIRRTHFWIRQWNWF